MRYHSNPEVIAAVELVDHDGDSIPYGDKIVGIQVRHSSHERDGMVDLDIRSFDKKDGNLVIRIPLPELMAAISCATLNADHDL